MLAIVARAGHRRAPHQTPAEFAAQLDHPAVIEITRLYQQARFGTQSLTEEEVDRVTRLLRELKGQKEERKRA